MTSRADRHGEKGLAFLEESWATCLTMRKHLPFNSAVPLLSSYPEEMLSNVHQDRCAGRSWEHLKNNIRKLETTEMPIHGDLVLNYDKSIQWDYMQLLKTHWKEWGGKTCSMKKLSRYIITLKTTARETMCRTLIMWLSLWNRNRHIRICVYTHTNKHSAPLPKQLFESDHSG